MCGHVTQTSEGSSFSTASFFFLYTTVAQTLTSSTNYSLNWLAAKIRGKLHQYCSML
jgi:hypothetical protein